ncbi:MAG TPA: efflux RND transporter periplasmic adaptor subunit [Puia sp.]
MSTKTITRNLISSPLLAAIAYFSIMFIGGCYAKAEDKAKAVTVIAPAAPGIPVDGYIVKPAVLKDELEITGTLKSNQEVDIVSELPRKIIRVNVKDGASVVSGQLLFEMDNADLLAQLEKLQQQAKLARLNEERLRDLIQHEAVVQQDYDQAFTNLKVLEAQITELQVALNKTRIRAPFGGQLGIVNVYPGAVVSANTILTHIQDNSQVKLDFHVPEKYAQTITTGSAQKFTVASDSRQYTAIVIAREAGVDQNTRTLLIRAVSQNPGKVLLAGQSARLQLSLHSSADALMVSSQALIPSSQGYSVYTVKSNQVQLSAIEIGQRGPYTVEVLHGLNKGDTVVTSNLLRLMPGSFVQFASLK